MELNYGSEYYDVMEEPAQNSPPPTQGQKGLSQNTTSTESSTKSSGENDKGGQKSASTPSRSSSSSHSPVIASHEDRVASQSQRPEVTNLVKWRKVTNLDNPKPKGSLSRLSLQAAKQTLAPPLVPEHERLPGLSGTSHHATPDPRGLYSQAARERRRASSQSSSNPSQPSCVDPRELLGQSYDSSVTIEADSMRSDLDQLESQSILEATQPVDKMQQGATELGPSTSQARPTRSQPPADTPEASDHDEARKVPGSPRPSDPYPQAPQNVDSDMQPPPSSPREERNEQTAPGQRHFDNRATATAATQLAIPQPIMPTNVVTRVARDVSMQDVATVQPSPQPPSVEARRSPHRDASPGTTTASMQGHTATHEPEMASSNSATQASSVEISGPAPRSQANGTFEAGPALAKNMTPTMSAPPPVAVAVAAPQRPDRDVDMDAATPAEAPTPPRYRTWRLEAAAYSRPCQGSDGTDMTQLTVLQSHRPTMLPYDEQREVLVAELGLLEDIYTEVVTTMAKRQKELEDLDKVHGASNDQAVDGSEHRSADEEGDENEDQTGGSRAGKGIPSKQQGGKRARTDNDQRVFAKPSLPKPRVGMVARRGRGRVSSSRSKPPAPMTKAFKGSGVAANFFKKVRKNCPDAQDGGRKIGSKPSASSSQARRDENGKESGSEQEKESETASESDEPAPKKPKKQRKKRAPSDEVESDDSESEQRNRRSKRATIDLTIEPTPPTGMQAAFAKQKKRESLRKSKGESDDELENEENVEPDHVETGAVRKSRRSTNKPVASYCHSGEYSQTTGLWRTSKRSKTQGRARSGSR